MGDSNFGLETSEFIGQDSGDVYALLTSGYNFDGAQTPAVMRSGDLSPAVLSLPNFYGAHGYDPELPHMSAIFYAAGPDIGNGTLPLVHNIDIAPTLNQLFDVPNYVQVDGQALPIAPLALVQAASRLPHSNAGTFDSPLPVNGSLGTDGRNPGDNLATLVLQFSKPLVGAVIPGAITHIDGTQVTLSFAPPKNGKISQIAGSVTDIYGGSLSIQLPFAFLRGDVNGDGVVDSRDVSLVRAASLPKNGAPVNSINFRADINLNGFVNQADVAQTNSRIGDTAN